MKSLVQQRISGSEEELNYLHEQHKWIPCRDQTRPIMNIYEKKITDIQIRQEQYDTKEDEILIEYFKYESIINYKTMKLKSKFPLNGERKYIFIPNEYPYQVPENTFHYVLWYSYLDVDKDNITHDVMNALKKICSDKIFEYVWYENPSMSVPEVYHVQVFWHYVK